MKNNFKNLKKKKDKRINKSVKKYFEIISSVTK